MANGRKRRRSAPRRASPSHALRVVVHDEGPATVEPARRTRVAHYDHDGSPRVTPARGASAHGFFQVYESCDDVTQALFLCDPAARTPAFVQFSSVLGARRGADTVRDVRAFAVKLFTAEGNFDLVGQSSPVLHIEDGVRFPDAFHARAPDPVDAPFDPESASLTPMKAALWSYACAAPRCASSLVWLLSERAQPRSLRMMAGYGVHTYRLVDRRGQAHLARFVWRPLLGVHALADDEAELLADEDPDFHRRDLWDAIEDGDFPEWELCLQLIDVEKARALDIDVLDATEALPEGAFPLRPVGKLTLTRHPPSFYKDTDDVDFHPSRTVPGIDFTDDPTLQLLLASGPQAPAFLDGTAGPVTRARTRVTALSIADEPRDPLAPARRLFAAMSQAERRRVVENAVEETGELPRALRLRALAMLRAIDGALVDSTRADDWRAPAAEQATTSIRSRRVAVLVADGVRSAHVDAVMSALQARGAHVDIIARVRGTVVTADGTALAVVHSHRTASSVFYDAVFVPGGADAAREMCGQADVIRFVEEAFRHGKPIGVLGEAGDVLDATALAGLRPRGEALPGVVQADGNDAADVARFVEALTAAMQHHRFFERPALRETNE